MNDFARHNRCVILIPTRQRGEMAAKLVSRLSLSKVPIYVCTQPGDPFFRAISDRASDFAGASLRYIIEEKPGIGQARRTLVKKAYDDGYYYGLMVDDDCWLNYKKIDEFFRRFAGSSYSWRGAWNTYYDLVGGKAGISMCSMVFGLRLPQVVNAGNFDSHLWIQEDGDMMMRLILAHGPKAIGHDKKLIFKHLHTRMSLGGNDHAYQDERAAAHSRYFNAKYGLDFTRSKGARVLIDRKKWKAATTAGKLSFAKFVEGEFPWYASRSS